MAAAPLTTLAVAYSPLTEFSTSTTRAATAVPQTQTEVTIYRIKPPYRIAVTDALFESVTTISTKRESSTADAGKISLSKVPKTNAPVESTVAH